MPTRRAAIAAAVLAGAGAALRVQAVPARTVRVFATTDRPLVQPLIDDFERRHAGWHVEYLQLGSVELYERFLAEGGRGADVLWSSAMDLQIKLVNDGHAARYESPHAARLPRWAVWKHEAYGCTYEPVGWAYDRRQFAAADVPATHAALAERLATDRARFLRRVATYDVERAGLGHMIAANDAMADPRSWELLRPLGRCEPELHTDSQAMLEGVAAGRLLLAYNVLGGYAEEFARRRPELGLVYPSDYTLVVSRVAFVARHAPQPRGARLWLDHLLSAHGQRILAEAGGLYSVRGEGHPRSAASLAHQLGRAARPVVLGPGLLAHLDHSRRKAFLKRWNEAVRHGR